MTGPDDFAVPAFGAPSIAGLLLYGLVGVHTLKSRIPKLCENIDTAELLRSGLQFRQ